MEDKDDKHACYSICPNPDRIGRFGNRPETACGAGSYSSGNWNTVVLYGAVNDDICIQTLKVLAVV